MSEASRCAVEELLAALDTINAANIDDVLEPPLRALRVIEVSQAPGSTSWSALKAEDLSYIVKNRLHSVQYALLTKVIPNIGHLESGKAPLWEAYFCPPIPDASEYSTAIALSAYTAIINGVLAQNGEQQPKDSQADIHPLVLRHSVDILSNLVRTYSLPLFFSSIVESHFAPRPISWPSFVSLYLSIPHRVANACSIGSAKRDSQAIPTNLHWRAFLYNTTLAFDALVSNCSRTQPSTDAHVAPLALLLGKIVRSGYLVPDSSQLSFWPALLPILRRRLLSAGDRSDQSPYSKTWQSVIAALTTTDLHTLSTHYFTTIQATMGDLEIESKDIKRFAMVTLGVFGPMSTVESARNEHLWDVLAQRCLIQKQNWTPNMARTAIAWGMLSATAEHERQGIACDLMTRVSSQWCSTQFITRADAASHTYLTILFLLTIKHIRPLHPELVKLSHSPSFLSSISTHLSSLIPSVRFEGMYIAQYMSQRTVDEKTGVKPLDFDDLWKEDITANAAAIFLERTLSQEDWSASNWELQCNESIIAELSDVNVSAEELPFSSGLTKESATQVANSSTSETGEVKPKIQVLASDYDDYDPPSPSSASSDELSAYSLPEPPPVSELKDLEDLSGYTPNKKKVPPPLYIHDLSAYLKAGAADGAEKGVEKLEVALMHAEGLIRRKQGWGTELEDNAVDLAITLIGLQDSYSLEGFEERRKNALVALLACCPTKSAPAIIEQFFTNHYSVAQRFTMLTSLAVSSRELAGLPSILPATDTPNAVPEVRPKKETFPSQRLPGSLHARFLAGQQNRRLETALPDAQELQAVSDAVTTSALRETRSSAEAILPEARREKLLAVGSRRRSSKISMSPANSARPQLQGAGQQPAHFASLAAETYIMPFVNRFWLYLRDVSTNPQARNLGPFAGGSAGSASLLDPMLLSKYLATLAVLINSARNSPHFLAVLAPEALELMLSLRGMATNGMIGSSNNQDVVLGSLLQVVLVVLDTSIAIDSGRTMAKSNGKQVWQIKDWAEKTWEAVADMDGHGQLADTPRITAGVLLRLDEIVQKTIGYH